MHKGDQERIFCIVCKSSDVDTGLMMEGTRITGQIIVETLEVEIP